MNLQQSAKNIRTTILKMIYNSKSSHIWSAFSVVDILTYIYFTQFKNWDKLILSKWHAWSALYATLAELWNIDKEKLINTYCTNWQKLWWHVTLWSVPWVDVTAWALWHWLSMWIWMALSLKKNRVYVILWDWEINEWSIWEWFLFAQQKKLNNLVVVIDKNGQQAMWPTKDIIDIPNLDKVMINLWWHVQVIDWNNFDDIERAFNNLSENQSNLIIADTIKWKWVDFMEDNVVFHYKTPTEEQYNDALLQINK
jgi:transketolase